MRVEVRVFDGDSETTVTIGTDEPASLQRMFKIAERAMSDLVNEPFTLPHSG